MNYCDMYKKASKEKRTRPMVPTFKKFREKGEMIVGRYVGKGEVEGTRGKAYQQYIFDTDDGMVKFSLGAFGDNEIGQQFVENHVYALTFTGTEETPGGNRVNKFESVELVEENV